MPKQRRKKAIRRVTTPSELLEGAVLSAGEPTSAIGDLAIEREEEPPQVVRNSRGKRTRWSVDETDA